MPEPQVKPKVVIADDEMMLRQILRAILAEGKYDIVGQATHGGEVIGIVQRFKPDLLCLDINMPNRDGIDVLKEIRQLMPDLKVIMVSADATSDKVKQAIALGASSFIVKPFNADQVLNRVNQIMRKAG